ncbi:hypothetical protein Hanom_Chr12g01149271 [Helianthus anomalus]
MKLSSSRHRRTPQPSPFACSDFRSSFSIIIQLLIIHLVDKILICSVHHSASMRR